MKSFLKRHKSEIYTLIKYKSDSKQDRNTKFFRNAILFIFIGEIFVINLSKIQLTKSPGRDSLS